MDQETTEQIHKLLTQTTALKVLVVRLLEQAARQSSDPDHYLREISASDPPDPENIEGQKLYAGIRVELDSVITAARARLEGK